MTYIFSHSHIITALEETQFFYSYKSKCDQIIWRVWGDYDSKQIVYMPKEKYKQAFAVNNLYSFIERMWIVFMCLWRILDA